jgi:hypothetical protein
MSSAGASVINHNRREHALKTNWIALLSFCTAATAAAQGFDDTVSRFMIGGGGGIFRISHDDFSSVYDGRTGFIPGGHALVKIKAPYNLIVKYRRFDKENLRVLNEDQLLLQWEQRFVNIGLRYVSYNERRFTQFFGFGVSWMNIKESGPLAVTSPNGGTREATGFYLELGADYRFVQRATLFFEIEISSAGVEGKSAFEGTSVGGYYFGLGLNAFLF